MPGISIQEITRRGRLLATRQITAYFRGDDGTTRKGLGEAYYVLTTGQYSGNSNIEVAHYAAPTISFTGPGTIADAGGGLAGWAVNNLMVIKGTALNDGVVTVTGIAGAPNNLTISAAVDEAAGAYVSLYKRTPHSNNCVFDRRTGLYLARYTSSGEKVGSASDGTLEWVNAASICPLHPAAADVAMVVPGNILRIVGGAAEITRYHEGDLLDPAGFVAGDDNLPGLYVLSATVNGADLDIAIDPMGLPVLVNEAAGANVSIGLVTRSLYNYAAGARLAGLAGYTDWRVPNRNELVGIMGCEAPNGLPDAVAFPGWPTDVWSSSTRPGSYAHAIYGRFGLGSVSAQLKTATSYCALVRG